MGSVPGSSGCIAGGWAADGVKCTEPGAGVGYGELGAVTAYRYGTARTVLVMTSI
ncbi:hypothetical protein IMZ48_34460 [Candidatus Bathyarchaeota archaeon]|nr:hypothetical protein [Candidatus Bathyarchaeota archaeon]